MKLTNNDVFAAVDAIAALCDPANRFPPVAHIAAGDNLDALRLAWRPVKEELDELAERFGEKHEDGFRVTSDLPGWAEYLKACDELGLREVDVPLRPIRLADVELGYSRDPETKKKGLLEISVERLAALRRLGVIVSGSEEASG